MIAAIDSLAEDPLTWPADPEAVRYYVLRRFPYTIHYEVAGTEVIVLAVAHRQFRELGAAGVRAFAKPNAVIYDVKYLLPAGAADGRL